MEGFLNQRKPMESEHFIYSGNQISFHVEAVGTYKLVLRSHFVLNLEKKILFHHFLGILFQFRDFYHLVLVFNLLVFHLI